MAEYVCELTSKLATDLRARRRERIVRCKDCKLAYEIYGTDELNCLYFSEWDYRNDCLGEWRVEPDGFCAWGVERGTGNADE